MSAMLLVILMKILITLLLVATPFLFFTTARLNRFTGIATETSTFYRLYGVAVLALLIGYASGIQLINEGIFPWGIAIMGIVSNGGAAALLLRSGAPSRSMPFIVIYGTIAAALIICVIFPEAAISQFG